MKTTPIGWADVARFATALEESGYEVVERTGRQPTRFELAGSDLERLLVYMWALRDAGDRRPRGQRRVGLSRPGSAPFPRAPDAWTLLLGYDRDRDVYAAWQVAGREHAAPNSSAWIPRETLDTARDDGIAFHRDSTRTAEVVTAFRPDRLGEYLANVPALEAARSQLERQRPPRTPPAAARRSAPRRRRADFDDAVRPPAREVPPIHEYESPWLAHHALGLPPAPRKPKRHDVATGFAHLEAPDGHLDRRIPLESATPLWLWLEIGDVVGSIERRPTPIPDSVPDGAELTVRLFEFDDDLELEGERQGRIRLLPDGDALVVERAATASASDDLHSRRLLFQVRTPKAHGDFQIRCNIYHGATLVQSRLIEASVGSAPPEGEAALRSTVDYALVRELSPAKLAHLPEHRLSIQVNGTNGTHQFRFFGAEAGQELAESASLSETRLQSVIERARGHLRRASWGTDAPWREDTDTYRYANGVTTEELHADLIWLAVNGGRLYDAIVKDLSGDRRAELAQMMRRPGTVQIAATHAGLYVPAAMFYDYPLYDGTRIPDGYEICHEFEDAMAAGTPLDQCLCFAGDCPTRDSPYVVCPSGLWGFRHDVGWPLSGDAASAELSVESGNPKLTVGVSTEFPRSVEHSRQIAHLGESRIVDSMRDLFDLMKAGDQHLVYLYCHGGLLPDEVPFVEIGARDGEAITRLSLSAFDIRWENPRPLVFINGCHTTALEPKQAIDLATGFIETANAIGVIGTEITVFEDFAADFAERALTAFVGERLTIGTAIRQTRLDLLAGRNPLGLAYVPFVAAGTRIVDASPKPPRL